MLKNLLNLLCVVVAPLVLVGCGGGGGSAVFSGSPKPVQASLMVVACNSVQPVYTEVLTSQSISSLSSDTEVEILHGQDGSKQVCVLTGSAQILVTQ